MMEPAYHLQRPRLKQGQHREPLTVYTDGSCINNFGWGEPPPEPTLCSDLVYFPELFGPLLRTLIHLTSPPCAPWSGPSVKIVVSYNIRSIAKETPFWPALGLWFSFRPVLMRCRDRSIESENASSDDGSGAPDTWRQFGAHEDTDRTFVFVAHRRSKSIAWHVPEGDKELMEGVGTRGTPVKKGDDTFETILLMSMGIDNTGE